MKTFLQSGHTSHSMTPSLITSKRKQNKDQEIPCTCFISQQKESDFHPQRLDSRRKRLMKLIDSSAPAITNQEHSQMNSNQNLQQTLLALSQKTIDSSKRLDSKKTIFLDLVTMRSLTLKNGTNLRLTLSLRINTFHKRCSVSCRVSLSDVYLLSLVENFRRDHKGLSVRF